VDCVYNGIYVNNTIEKMRTYLHRFVIRTVNSENEKETILQTEIYKLRSSSNVV